MHVLIGCLPQGKGSTLKAATAVNVRHILCEKQSKALEALQKIQVRLSYPSSPVLITTCDDQHHRKANVSIRWPKSTPRTRPKVIVPIPAIHTPPRFVSYRLRQLGEAWAGWSADPWWYVHGYDITLERLTRSQSTRVVKGAFQDAAFALQPSTVDKPILSPLVKTQFGYHIIMVEGRR